MLPLLIVALAAVLVLLKNAPPEVVLMMALPAELALLKLTPLSKTGAKFELLTIPRSVKFKPTLNL
ncbi:hypothetical protein [uncultured Bradyrhizobium sp.]|uniref:hypothetical protein n=1 Tax=Bradyrhizobium sp. TaxID=376 RepID=UPI0026145E9C|nr:hypothetical protein [uncultured Bradyrhizobium sp.]